MKRINLKTVLSITGKPMLAPKEGEEEPTEANIADLLKILVFSLPPAKLTMQDSIEAHRLMKQIDAATDSILELEEGTHDWAKKKVEEFAPQIYRVNAVMLRDALDDFERAHEKAEKKPVKEE